MARILLVEDNEMIRDMLRERLERDGHLILVAGDGANGVELAQSEKPDLILLDMSLPVMDGWQAAQRIKEVTGPSPVPIIGLTAYALTGDRDRCLGAGCDEYAAKPIDYPALLTKIQVLVTRGDSYDQT